MAYIPNLTDIVFSGLSALVIEDAEDAGEVICVRARTQDAAVACLDCGTPTCVCRKYIRAGEGRVVRRPEVLGFVAFYGAGTAMV